MMKALTCMYNIHTYIQTQLKAFDKYKLDHITNTKGKYVCNKMLHHTVITNLLFAYMYIHRHYSQTNVTLKYRLEVKNPKFH